MKLCIISLLAAFFVLAATNSSVAQLFGKQPEVITGKQTVNQLSKDTEQQWFTNGMENYKSDPETIAAIKKNWTPDLKIVAFGGSWCPDTHREMPGFFRCLQDAGINKEAANLYFLDRKFKSGTGEEKKYGISSVPTFVVLRNNTEIGRIKAKPGNTPEVLLLQIISK